MEFEKIEDTKSFKFKQVWDLYTSAFPEDERREIEKQQQTITNPEYTLFSIRKSGKFVGFIDFWELGFLFIEHIAVVDSMRGLGIGSNAIRFFLAKMKGLSVLEIEPPDTEIQKKRIGFYQRLGFKLNKHPYIQPSYSSDKKSVKMFLMSYPRELTEEKFAEVKARLYEKVYGLI